MARVLVLLVVAVFLCAIIAPTANADGISGASVDVSARFPTMGTVFQDGGVKTVNGTVEYPSGTFALYNPTWSVELTNTQIIITNALGGGFPFGTAPFNGFAIDFLTGTITGATADAASGFDPVGISIVGNILYLNYSGVTGSSGISSIIDVTGTGVTTTPEPSSLLLLGSGLVGLGGALWRKRLA